MLGLTNTDRLHNACLFENKPLLLFSQEDLSGPVVHFICPFHLIQHAECGFL